MTNVLFKAGEAMRKSISSCGWTKWFVLNAALFFGLVILGIVNFSFHARYPVVIAWLPSGLAFGVVLLQGFRLLPGVILGTGATVLAMAGDPDAAVIFGFANGAACSFAWALIRVGKSIDYASQTVGSVGRLLLAGGAVYGLTAFLLGPYAISHVIGHVEAKPNGPATMLMSNRTKHDVPRQNRSVHHGAVDTAATETAHTRIGKGHHSGDGGTLERLLTDPIGVLLITPLVLYFRNGRNNCKAALEDYRGAISMLAMLVGVTLSIYSGYLEDRFGIVHTTLLVLPPAVWLALRYDLSYTIAGNIAVLFISGIGTSLGHGPFSDHTSGLPLLTVVFSLTTLLVAASRTERRVAEETIQRLATRDALTGIPNRSSFGERMEQALYGAQRYNRKVALMFIDLDHFKKINDVLGHQVGDLLLTEVARRIQACLREDSMLARFGGDEFVVLVDPMEERNTLTIIAERIAEAVSAPFEIVGHDCHVACSIGISVYPDHGNSVEELMRKADIAMYAVKASGRNGFRFYSPEMHNGMDSERRAWGDEVSLRT